MSASDSIDFSAQGFSDVFLEDAAQDDTVDGATVEAIRLGTSSIPDLEAAERLVDQVAGVMVAVATGGPRINDVKADYAADYRALTAVLRRLEIDNPNPFHDLWQWYGKWNDDSTLASWASRRTFVASMYSPVRAALDNMASSQRDVASGTADGPTGWSEVDAKLSLLRRRIRGAEGEDDFKAIGLLCVALLEALGRAVFDASQHLPVGKEMPHLNDAKQRVGYFLGSMGDGSRFEEVRTLLNATWRQAQATKHREPNLTDAGITADATALSVAIIRRIADEDAQRR